MAKIEMPSSSINSTGESPKKQLKKVTTGKVTIKQESEIQKLAHNFLAEDLQTIREKLWTDYILPGIKNMVCSAVNIALFGVDRSHTNTKKNYIYLNEYTMYVVEDITGTHTDPYHYKLYFHTDILPDVEVRS